MTIHTNIHTYSEIQNYCSHQTLNYYNSSTTVLPHPLLYMGTYNNFSMYLVVLENKEIVDQRPCMERMA